MITKAQRRALAWLAGPAKGFATIDRYGNARDRDGNKAPFASQTWLRLFLKELIATQPIEGAFGITMKGLEALKG